MARELYQDKYRIASSRLKGFDYTSEAAYFITICTEGMSHSLGKIINEELKGNRYAEISNKYWNDLPNHYPSCHLDQFVIMPNQVHGIIMLIYPVDMILVR